MESDDPRRNELIASMFQLRGEEFERCFWPDMSCRRPAIRAHSVQNARALDLLAESGHVVAPVLRMNVESGPSIELQRVGRNRATTFAGLCAEHDREIFAPIEIGDLDVNNPEHLFLLAYRATFYETHSSAAAVVVMQSAYLKRADLGLDSRDESSLAGRMAVERMYAFHQTWLYKSEFDFAYLNKRFDAIQHDVLELSVEKPSVAACALFSLDDVHRDDDIVRVCLTVLPVEERKTLALFSYLPPDAVRARFALDRVLNGIGSYQKYELSRRLINHCQNFVLSPSFVDAWTGQQKQIVTGLFHRTVGANDFDFDDPALMLFT